MYMYVRPVKSHTDYVQYVVDLDTLSWSLLVDIL